MEPSIAGILVLAGLLALGRCLRAPIIVGLFASLAFGSTAIATLSALGGSSPLVFTAFVLLLLVSVSLRSRFLDDLSIVFTSYRTAWIVGALLLYSILSAILLPRFLAGQTSALVTVPGGAVQELPLAPVSGNITQTGYFVLGALTFFAFSILFLQPRYLEIVRRAYFTWIVLHATLGIVDLSAKLIGAGDILLPIRTASYIFLVEVEEAGFWRITGGYSEASTFGAVTLTCLAFTFTYWRVGRSPQVFALAFVLFLLLLFSTSSTAYAGFAILAPFAVASIFLSVFRGRLSSQDLLLFGLTWFGLIAVLTTYLFNERFFDPLVNLLETVVLNKSNTESAAIRGYLNSHGIQALLETGGLGIGMGSSRTSSWLISVFSQLGIIGGLMMMGLVGILVWDMVAPKPRHSEVGLIALASGARACALASLVGITIAGGGADPGLFLFIGLAIVTVYRGQASISAPGNARPLPMSTM